MAVAHSQEKTLAKWTDLVPTMPDTLQSLLLQLNFATERSFKSPTPSAWQTHSQSTWRLMARSNQDYHKKNFIQSCITTSVSDQETSLPSWIWRGLYTRRQLLSATSDEWTLTLRGNTQRKIWIWTELRKGDDLALPLSVKDKRVMDKDTTLK